jgi:hypothetical protein
MAERNGMKLIAANAQTGRARPELDNAKALGWCRIYDRPLDQGEGDALSRAAALAATRELTAAVREATESARTLGDRYDEEYNPAESEKLCVDVLQRAMDSWAAFVAIDDVYEGLYYDGSGGPGAEFQEALNEAMIALDSFDDALRNQLDVLSILAESETLSRWREGMAPEFSELPPWWLDGTIEGEAQRLQEELDRVPVPKRATISIESGRGQPAARRPWRQRRLKGLAAKDDIPDEGPFLNRGGRSQIHDELDFDFLCWRAPDQNLYAELEFPVAAKPSQMLDVVFDASGGRFERVLGKTATLTGVPGEIGQDDGGRVVARFPFGELQQLHPEHPLTVDGETWLPWDPLAGGSGARSHSQQTIPDSPSAMEKRPS